MVNKSENFYFIQGRTQVGNFKVVDVSKWKGTEKIK